MRATWMQAVEQAYTYGIVQQLARWLASFQAGAGFI